MKSRKAVTVTATALAASGVAAGVTAWVRYLARRQHHWRGLLSDAIPVHSLYWREQAAKQGELLYVAVGDSAAQGIGASRPAHGYVGFVAKHLRERSGRTVRVVNLGISGARLREAIEKELPRLAKLEPDVLTVSIGANDMADFDPQRFETEIATVFDALPGHAIVADLPSFYFLPAERKVLEANRILREAAAASGLRVVPLHQLTKRQGLWGVSTQFAGDLFHPNDRGYRVWASAFAPAVDERLKKLSP
ncbi:SGNH/GDSL hydrolase family protein [Herbiconiux sp. P15]|uniref:SGNH/GDSL hydrolase family protein n=1 Tax=Herbiconiux liukaitaii TaxID=3342799 RepID=UPI0035B85261